LSYLLAALVIVMVMTVMPALASSTLEHWRAHDPNSEDTVDHSGWSEFLSRYVIDCGSRRLVAYGEVSRRDHQALQSYLARMSETEVTSLSRPVQKAYWLNLYNAITVDLVLDHYPIESIRDIDSGLFDSGPWDESRISVEGRALSLDDIEHRILREIWPPAMIHYGLNCAAMGCPDLTRRAFTGKKVDAMLRAIARRYISEGPGVLRIEQSKATISSIYRWYSEDFGGTDASILAHLRRFAEGGRATALEAVSEIDGFDYDWSLNVAKVEDDSRQQARR